jgi:hypothetical protein
VNTKSRPTAGTDVPFENIAAMINRIVPPTYDSVHYNARAERYARAAQCEPHPNVRAALLVLADACRDAASAVATQASPVWDIGWQD